MKLWTRDPLFPDLPQGSQSPDELDDPPLLPDFPSSRLDPLLPLLPEEDDPDPHQSPDEELLHGLPNM